MMIIYASDEEEDGDEPSNKMVSSSMSWKKVESLFNME
jgi:hypothetical protein